MRLIRFIGYTLIVFVTLNNQSFSNPLDKLFDKKWCLDGFPSHLKDSVYNIYSPKIAGGSEVFYNGKLRNSKTLQWFRFSVLGENKIKYERRYYAYYDRLMVQILGSPTALTGKTIQIITFESDKKIKSETEVYRIDLKLSNKNNLTKFNAKKSQSTSTLCDKKE